MAVVNVSSYDEFADFIASSPSLDQIAQFRLSPKTERHISDLLAAHREGRLTPEQQAELDEFLRVEHLMRKVKIRAFEKLDRGK